MKPCSLAWRCVSIRFVGSFFFTFGSKDSLGTKTKKEQNRHEYKELSQHSSGQNNVKGHTNTHSDTQKLNNEELA